MSGSRTAGNIFLGMIWLAVAVLLLVSAFGYRMTIWESVARYWPVVVIVWGLLKIPDHYRLKEVAERRALFPVVEVASLILFIFAGTAITTAANIISDHENVFGIGDVDLWDITGNNFKFEEHDEAAVPADSMIEIFNMYGDVYVTSSDADRIQLDVKKTIRALNSDEAGLLSKDFMFSVMRDGGKYRIASNQSLFPRQRYKSSLNIRVPKRAMLRIQNRNGNVEVVNVTGNQDIDNRYGDVHLSFMMPPDSNVHVATRVGGATVQLPPNSSFAIDARAEFGQIDSEFDGVRITRSNDRSSANGRVGGEGGAAISISTQAGNIRIRKKL